MIEYVTTGSFFTNSYIISNNGKCVIVDPGQRYEKIAETIKNKYEVEAILLTHGHLDHIDGARFFNTKVYINELDEEMLYDSRSSLYLMMNERTPYKKGDLNIIRLKDLDEFNLIGYNFKLLHTPGHTIGSSIYYFDNNMFTGDTLFKMSCGRTDFPTGSITEMENSLKRIKDFFIDDYTIYPGHGEITSLKKEIECNPYLRSLL